MRWTTSILLGLAATHLTGVNARLIPRRHSVGSHVRHDDPSATVSLAAVPTQTHRRHGQAHHHHSHHGAPLAKLNETDIETQHGPRWQSYMRYDLGLPVPKPVLEENLSEWQILHDTLDQDHPTHRGLMLLHIVLMFIAFFGALPICFILRAAKHRAHHAAFIVFLATSVAGWLAGMTYSHKTPDLYEGAVHGTHGTLFMIFILSLCALDHLRYLKKAYHRVKQWKEGDKPHYRLAQDRCEKVGILSGTIATEASKWPMWPSSTLGRRSSDVPASGDLTVGQTACSPGAQSFTTEPMSEHCPSPLQGCSHEGPYEQCSWQMTVQNSLLSLHNFFFKIVVVIMAYGTCVTGAVTYIGYGHDDEAGTVIGHLVPASLLVIWGLVGFLRYTGNFARGGWAWPESCSPRRRPSLEMMSCLALLVYAIITLGFELAVYNSADPRQTQHLGMHIVVFCSSAIGVLLESKTVQSFTQDDGDSTVSNERTKTLNPCSAISTALGGLVFLQHPQPYVFAVDMHKLAGAALLTSAVCRFATCALSWIGAAEASNRKKSLYPPTELLASLALTTGGFAFMFSSEEVGYDAMRLGFDDSAIFMCVAAALTSFLFFWLLFLKTIGAWALARRRRLDL